jgi:hypothetical protein
MTLIVLECVKIILLCLIISGLKRILYFVELIWNNIFDIHIVVVRKEDPKKYGGKG